MVAKPKSTSIGRPTTLSSLVSTSRLATLMSQWVTFLEWSQLIEAESKQVSLALQESASRHVLTQQLLEVSIRASVGRDRKSDIHCLREFGSE